MNKLKLEIQRFSSTNETTHYQLSQYIGTDKPTYLVDYNSDMSKIDTGIYDADAKGTQANNNIGTMANLTTSVNTDLVSAINEVDAHADTNATNISNNTTDIATNTSAIGTLANLDTTAKNNLVSAINEVKSDIPTVSDSILNTSSNSTTDTYSCDYINGLTANRIIEKGRIYTNVMTSFTFGSETFAHKEVTFTGSYTNAPMIITNMGTSRSKDVYGNIAINTRSVTNTGFDLVTQYDVNSANVWVDYIVISMD